MGETEIISVHPFRWRARKREQRLQASLGVLHNTGYSRGAREAEREALRAEGVPGWAMGVRVRRAGPFQHVVEVTSWRGH